MKDLFSVYFRIFSFCSDYQNVCQSESKFSTATKTMFSYCGDGTNLSNDWSDFVLTPWLLLPFLHLLVGLTWSVTSGLWLHGGCTGGTVCCSYLTSEKNRPGEISQVMKTLNIVCLELHTCPLMISLPLALAVVPLRNCPGLCFSAANSRALRDFVISYKSTLHVLWWWVKIRTRLCCFEMPLSFEPLT